MGSLYSIASATNSIANQSDSTGSSSGVLQAIKNAASRTGVDFSYLVKKASQESGLDSTAKSSSSSASGLFQFTSQTWLSMIKNHGADYGLSKEASQITTDASGHLSVSDPVARHAILALRNDPQTSAEMAGELDKQNAAILKQNVGGKIGGTELYLAHFLGAGGASEFLNNLHADPTAAAADVVPSAAAANQSIFFDKNGEPRSLKQIYQHFAAKFDGILSPASTPATQVASVAPTISNPVLASAAASVSTAEATLSSLMPQANAATTTVSPAATTVGSNTATHLAGVNISLSNSSAQFAALVLGQMDQPDKGIGASLANISLTQVKKKTGAALAVAA